MADCWQISSVEKIPVNLLPALAGQLGIDAVLFTDVTHYFPYQPIAIGIRCKLVDARSGDIRWAFDHLFDSGKPQVAHGACQFHRTNSRTNLPIGNDGSSVLQSPHLFANYVRVGNYRNLSNKLQPTPAEIPLVL